MALVTSDIQLYQTVTTDSLGGAISGTAVPQSVNQFFSDVDQDEATDGSVKYRCFYVQNDDDTDTLGTAEIYISVRTPNPSTSCEIGLGTSAINGTEQTVADETVPPVGVVFKASSDVDTVALGDLTPGDYIAVWIKRTVGATAAGSAADFVGITVTGTIVTP